MHKRLLLPLLFAAACSSALADQAGTVQQPAGMPQAQIALANAPAKVRAPYDVQIMRENGDTLPTYGFKDRYYVQGDANERYIIRVTNPTPNRIEAVVTVDGLDVIDGEDGDLHKRGYVIPPYGETRIEGFRTSEADVATFRFSSVNGSYAGMKGKPRNVGVIAVALFEEQHVEPVQIVQPDPDQPVTEGRPYDYRDDLSTRSGDMDRRRAPAAENKAPSGGYVGASNGASSGAGAPADPPAPPAQASRPAPPATPPMHAKKSLDKDEEYGGDDGRQQEAQKRERPGLGTEYGEERYSAASYTRFVRSADRPVAIAELRYNDAAGLTALGIPVQPSPDQGEIMTRETADPFPGDSHFSRAPR